MSVVAVSGKQCVKKVIRFAEVLSATSIQPSASNQLFSFPSCQPRRLVTLSLPRVAEPGRVEVLRRWITKA